MAARWGMSTKSGRRLTRKRLVGSARKFAAVNILARGGLRFGLAGLVLLGAVASRCPGKRLEWDAQRLHFRNSEPANQLVRRRYRKGWDAKGLS